MPDPETKPNEVEAIKVKQEAKESIQKELTAADTSEKKEALGEKLQQELREARTPAEKFVIAEQQARLGRAALTPIDVQNGSEALRTIIRAAEAARNDITISKTTEGQAILAKLGQRIAERGIDISSAAAIEAKMADYLLGNKQMIDSGTGQVAADFQEAFDDLKTINPTAASLLGESLIEAAREGKIPGLTEEEARKRFGMEREEKKREEILEEQEFETEWRQQQYGLFFTDDNKIVVKALYSVDGFVELAKDTMRNLVKAGEIRDLELNRLSDDEKRKITEEIGTRIKLLFSGIYRKIDEESQRRSFEEIEKAGLFSSAEVIFQRLDGKRRQLGAVVEKMEAEGTLPEILRQMKFFGLSVTEEVAERVVEYEKVDEKGKLVTDEHGKVIREKGSKPIKRIIPWPTEKPIPFSKFLIEVIPSQVQHDIEFHRYSQNVGMFMMRADVDPQLGFWGQLANYADTMMRATDIDGITHLPDYPLIMVAYSLYTKYLHGKFAEFDWIHQSDLFSPDIQSFRTKIQAAVERDLKIMFPEKTGLDAWRIRRAMSLGLGLARGVFITEQEAQAWADPQLTQEKGQPTVRSYGTNDNAGLNALNPLHTFLRWHSEGAFYGPLLFTLVSGFKPKFGIWDHKKLFERMKQFDESFMQGQQVFGKERPEEKLFIETLINIGRLGSIITRDGWSLLPAYEGWYQYKKDPETGMETANFEFLKTFRSLQYIGFEAAKAWINSSVENKPDFLAPKTDEGRKERDEFFRYLYKRYINPNLYSASDQAVQQALINEIGVIRPIAEKTIDDLISLGKVFNPHSQKRLQLIEAEIYKRLIYQALAGMVRERMPTKFIVLERNRLSQDGPRAWEKARLKMNINFEEMDGTVRDLQLVETKLRLETTEAMNKHLGKNKNPNLYDFETDQYRVNEESIERILGEVLKNTDLKEEERNLRIDKAKELFKIITTNYADLSQFGERLRETDAAGNIKDKYFPFAIAPEELENSFLAYRSCGDKILKRRLGDIAGGDKVTFAELGHFLKQLRETSIDGKHDFMPLIDQIEKIKNYIESTIGKDYGQKVAYNLVAMVKAYYLKDTVARNFFTKWSVVGEHHSLASRFAGKRRGVWEWGVDDLDKFMFEVERRRILPKEPYDTSKPASYEEAPMVRIFGKEIGTRKVRKPDFEYGGGKARREHGIDMPHMIWEGINKLLPLFMLFLIWQFVIKPFLEEMGGRKK